MRFHYIFATMSESLKEIVRIVLELLGVVQALVCSHFVGQGCGAIREMRNVFFYGVSLLSRQCNNRNITYQQCYYCLH